MSAASETIKNYFSEIDQKLGKCYAVAGEARSKRLDPEDKVDIPLAKSMAERVEGLISSIKPEIIGSGLAKRIEELESKYGELSLEVGMVIAHEVSEGKFCKFEGKLEAIEAGIKTGFAYLTIGIVSAPLEGLTELKIKQRNDGKPYLAAFFSGPVRGAGGTAMAMCLVIADYVRKMHGYGSYDPSPAEQARFVMELEDYHERVTNLQYRPSSEEIVFLVRNCPVEIDGDPTEKLEVSQHKDLPRVETNRIRGGVALVVSMLALKSPKLVKELSRVRKNFDIGWDFIEEFIKLQTKKKSMSEKREETGITPDYTFISDLVAGRPVLTYPLRTGGFRLRYGRTRMSGYSAAAINPATLHVLDKYVATGTQLKVERPGKAAAITPCDSIDGPIVKLKDGSVVRLDSDKDIAANPGIEEVIYLGDILVSYGDFYDRNHVLAPPGYCEEWHLRELEAAATDEEKRRLADKYSEKRFPEFPSAAEAIAFSAKLGVPLHPRYTYFWNAASLSDISSLLAWLKKAKITDGKIILPLSDEKKTLEDLGIPHRVAGNEFAVISPDDSAALLASLGLGESLAGIDSALSAAANAEQDDKPLDLINKISAVRIRDKKGTFIGARMGRPEKAKMRRLAGSPHVLFPVGKQGGRFRSFQAVVEGNKPVRADLPAYLCPECSSETVYKVCEKCGAKTGKLVNCRECGPTLKCDSKDHLNSSFFSKPADVKSYFKSACKLLGEPSPDLVKGVKGTSNRDHVPEHLLKGILRAKHSIAVNKDGTTRYDMSELPITHFKPREIGTSVEILKKLGYSKDVEGKPLESPDQILEIFPQDVILPSSPESVEESADVVLLNVANFIDELLEKLYGLEPFYKAKSKDGLIGVLVVGIAPHISAGIVGRILGFSKTQTLLAHPLFHAAMRRDADGDEACVILAMDALLNFSRQYLPDSRGAKTMDSPLVLTPWIIPAEVDDMVHRFDVPPRYPLEFYEAACSYRMPFEVSSIELLGARLGKETQYEGLIFTHSLGSINSGILMSAYKTLPSMEEKLKGQMILAEKIRAVDEQDVARLVIEKHFLKDVRGNLRKFSTQQFRCIECNKKFRRPPLSGSCDSCRGKLLFTVSEGSVIKYLEPAISLAEKYKVSPYLMQVLDLTQHRVNDIFGKENDKQEGLGRWFG